MISPARLLGNALDAIIGIVNPRAGLQRSGLRSAMYAAAKSPRTIGSWSPVDSRINDIIGNSAAPVRARIRQLVRDFPYFANAATTLCDYVVGPGIVYQSAIRDSSGKLSHRRIQQAEDAWNFWCDEADAAGRLHLYELMNLARLQECETGEYIIVKRTLRESGRYMPLALQMYEADWLAATAKDVKSLHAFSQGIEYDPATGRAIAYHFSDPDGWGKSVRVPSAAVIHGFKTRRPGQLRGISDFAPGVMVANDLSAYMDAEIDAAKMAAKWVGTIETADPFTRQQGLASDSQGKIESIENAILEYLRPGEKLNLMANPRPGSNFPPMVKLILTMFSVVSGVPYELLSGNYEGMNYSTGKMVRNDFAHRLRPLCARHIRGFCLPVQKAFLESAVLAGRLPWPDFFANPAKYSRSTWQPPGMESIDIARETKSMIDQINAGLRSPQEIAQARGRDLEDIYREIKEAEEMASRMGITLDLGQINTALKNNPAAIAEQKPKQPTTPAEQEDDAAE
jgi:lambda family phage portal protein